LYGLIFQTRGTEEKFRISDVLRNALNLKEDRRFEKIAGRECQTVRS
jgi:hypothetical protein